MPNRDIIFVYAHLNGCALIGRKHTRGPCNRRNSHDSNPGNKRGSTASSFSARWESGTSFSSLFHLHVCAQDANVADALPAPQVAG